MALGLVEKLQNFLTPNTPKTLEEFNSNIEIQKNTRKRGRK
jgi:hypothetical protein